MSIEWKNKTCKKDSYAYVYYAVVFFFLLLKQFTFVGVRGLNIQEEFVKFTGIGVYLEDKAVSSLAAKWKGKSAAELLDSLDFYRDIIKGTKLL